MFAGPASGTLPSPPLRTYSGATGKLEETNFFLHQKHLPFVLQYKPDVPGVDSEGTEESDIR